MYGRRTRGVRHAWQGALLLLVLCHVLLICRQRLLPFVDVPVHLAWATVFRAVERQEPGVLASAFQVSTGLRPNQFHVRFLASNLFHDPETAVKVYYCLYIVAMPLSLAMLVGGAGGRRSLCLLSFVLLYNLNTMYGFMGYTLAIPMIIVFVALLDRLYRSSGDPPRSLPGGAGRKGSGGPTTAGATSGADGAVPEDDRDAPQGASLILTPVAIALFPVCLYFVHVLACMFACLLLSALCALSVMRRGRRASKTLLAVSSFALLTSLLLIAAWKTGQVGGPGVIAGDPRPMYTSTPVFELVRRIPRLFFVDLIEISGAVGALAMYVLLAAGILLSYRRLTRPEIPDVPSGKDGAFAAGTTADTQISWVGDRDVLFVFLACACACYFLLPHRFVNGTWVAPRFSVYVLLALVALASTSRVVRRCGPLFDIFLVSISVTQLCFVAAYFHGFERACRGFDRDFLPDAPPTAVLDSVIADRCYRLYPVFDHFADYYIVWKNGLVVSLGFDAHESMIRRRLPLSRLPAWRNPDLGAALDYRGRKVDFLLVRGRLGAGEMEAVKRCFTLLRRRGAWSLFRRLRPAEPSQQSVERNGRGRGHIE